MNVSTKTRGKKRIICSFCGQEVPYFDTENDDNQEVDRVFLGLKRGSYICSKCVAAAAKRVFHLKAEYTSDSKSSKCFESNSIISLKNILDSKVVANSAVKHRLIAILLYHKWRISDSENSDFPKQHVLLMGDTGIGKTMIVTLIAKYLNIPCVIVDATTITKTGFVGDDVSVIPQLLLDNSGGDIEKAQKGIVIVDEIDKLCVNQNRYVSYEAGPNSVQTEFLKLMEEKTVVLSQHPQGSGFLNSEQPRKVFNTKDLTFICLGAFINVRAAFDKDSRINKKLFFIEEINESGELQTSLTALKSLHSSLINAGMITELVGRFQSILIMDPLTEENFKDILLNESTSPLLSYKKYFLTFNVSLFVSEEVIDFIAKEAFKLKLGVRGIYNILNSVVQPKMFDIVEKGSLSGNLIVHLEIVNNDLVIV